MATVTGLGGIFMRSTDRKSLMNWYRYQLGIEPAQDFAGATFAWRDAVDPEKEGSTILGLFEQDTDYFGPENPPFMVNFRVDNLDAMLETLRAKGQKVEDRTEDVEGIGRFGWVTDPEGRLIELWEPADGV